jgi:hypothetical protein
MKIGDLVTWVSPQCEDLGPINTGIIVDGPRDGCAGVEKVNAYAVVWFQGFQTRQTYWHTELNLELLSEYR